MQVVGLQKKLA